MDGKLLAVEHIRELENIKYISRLYRNGAHICNGCLISPRHIVSSAACIKELLKKIIGIRSKLFAVIRQKEHKIINAVYHSNYKPEALWNYRFYDVGVAMVRLLISCIF